MAREQKEPIFFPSKRGWFTQIAGKKIRLATADSPDDKEAKQLAWDKFRELMALKSLNTAGDAGSLYAIMQAFLNEKKRTGKPETHTHYRKWLQSFIDHNGDCAVRDLRQHHVTVWVSAHPTWGQVTERNAKTALLTCLNWAVQQGLISKNPLKGIPRPRNRSRGRSAVISDDLHERLMSAAHPAFKLVLFALRETGCRPGELCRVTAADFDPQGGKWVLSDHKTERFGKRRVIYLTPGMVELSRKLAELHPDGTLFRNSYRRAWTPNAIKGAYYELRKLLGLPKGTFAYGNRHTFATRLLESGRSMAVVAGLLGDDISMLMHHYSHVAENDELLRGSLIAGSTPDAVKRLME